MPTSCAAVVAAVANAVEMLFPQDQGKTGLFKVTGCVRHSQQQEVHLTSGCSGLVLG